MTTENDSTYKKKIKIKKHRKNTKYNIVIKNNQNEKKETHKNITSILPQIPSVALLSPRTMDGESYKLLVLQSGRNISFWHVSK